VRRPDRVSRVLKSDPSRLTEPPKLGAKQYAKNCRATSGRGDRGPGFAASRLGCSDHAPSPRKPDHGSVPCGRPKRHNWMHGDIPIASVSLPRAGRPHTGHSPCYHRLIDRDLWARPPKGGMAWRHGTQGPGYAGSPPSPALLKISAGWRRVLSLGLAESTQEAHPLGPAEDQFWPARPLRVSHRHPLPRQPCRFHAVTAGVAVAALPPFHGTRPGKPRAPVCQIHRVSLSGFFCLNRHLLGPPCMIGGFAADVLCNCTCICTSEVAS
jgi:hypothetical protein